MGERFTLRTITGKYNINLNGAYNIFDDGEILDAQDVVDRLNEYEEMRIILLHLNHELREKNEKLQREIGMLKTTISRNENYIAKLKHTSKWSNCSE